MKLICLTLEKQFKSLHIAYTYRGKFINEQVFTILYDAHKSTNLEFPYRNHEKFELDETTEDECMAEFRFTGSTVMNLLSRCSRKRKFGKIRGLEMHKYWFLFLVHDEKVDYFSVLSLYPAASLPGVSRTKTTFTHVGHLYEVRQKVSKILFNYLNDHH